MTNTTAAKSVSQVVLLPGVIGKASRVQEQGEIAPILRDVETCVIGDRRKTAAAPRRVIAEVLRLYPPTWLTARMTVEDDTLAGYTMASGAIVLLSPYVTHRHPAVWEAPERFDPDRFAPARAAARPTMAYFPFGGGPRRCIGSAFATTEMQLIVAAVAQRYRLTLVRDARVSPTAGLTLRPGPAVPSWLHSGKLRPHGTSR
jgi:cytochrome P450